MICTTSDPARNKLLCSQPERRSRNRSSKEHHEELLRHTNRPPGVEFIQAILTPHRLTSGFWQLPNCCFKTNIPTPFQMGLYSAHLDYSTGFLGTQWRRLLIRLSRVSFLSLACTLTAVPYRGFSQDLQCQCRTVKLHKCLSST